MVRSARPSDVYRLPEQTRPAPPRRHEAPEPDGPQRRFPAWLAVAGVLAVALVVSGAVLGASTPTTGEAPLVDIVSEDQAIAALSLYGAEAWTLEDLVERREIFSTPGPGASARRAGQGADAVEQALEDARDVPNPDALAAAYWDDGGHAVLAERLRGLQQLGDFVAMLTNTHDTLYAGAGSVPLPEAYQRISSAVSGGGYPAPVRAWGYALLEEMEERPRQQQAARSRARTQRLWAQVVTSLQPAAVPALVEYLNGLPPVTVDGLRGHPVAGPALQTLERQTRQVSRDEVARAAKR